jgi:hypothetical protein
MTLTLLVAALPLAATPLHDRIDARIAAGHPNFEKVAAPPASDAEFLRRVTLDLTGTVPTAAETRAFLADKAPDKRARRIDALLGSVGYARRMAQVFDVALMERRADVRVPRAEWENFLRDAFARNLPYDQLVRQILAADGVDPKARGPAKFLLDRNLEPNLVTRDVARLFLGRNLQCAQCHDHPNVDDYKQDQFYGIYAFLNRSYLFPDAGPKAVIAEKADGEVTFVSVFDKSKVQKSTGPRMLRGKPLPEPTPVKGKEYTVAPAKDVRPVPAYSRRARLADAVTAADNPAFARTAANRLWAVMFGRGLVQPLDFDHPENPPSHPELLDLLAAEFAAQKFDVKALLREIALSRTYQRSSEVPAGLTDMPADRYLVAPLKPLSPEQFGYAIVQATGQADAERLALGKGLTDAALDARLAGQVGPFRNAFVGRPGEPEGGGFTATLDQTLFLKFGGPLRALLNPRPGNLADRLGKLNDPAAVADELFVSVLTRPPTDEERREVAESLAGPDRAAALREWVWVLIASGEFRFNH